MAKQLENVEDIYEIAPLQREVLNRGLQNPGGLSVWQWVYRADGIDVPLFLQAVQRVVDRHPILRTSFHHEGLTKAVQVVRRRATLPVEEHDWRSLAQADRAARIGNFLKGTRTRRFTLTEAPLIRLAVLRIQDNVSRHVWTAHPILLDGWSRSLFFQEVFACYEALRRGEELQASRAGLYRDYIVWLQEQDREKAEAFWRQSLKGFTTPTSVTPGGAGRQRKHRRKIEVERLPLSNLVTGAVKEVARREGVTPGTLMQGAWALLLARLGGRDDVLFGSTVSGRPATMPGADSTLGLFANNLPVRVHVPAEKGLLPWLKELHAHLEEAVRFGYLPLGRIRGWGEVPADRPIFETLVAADEDPTSRGRAPWRRGVKVSPLQRTAQQGGYPLVMMPGRDGSSLRIAYATDCFDAPAVRKMLQQLRRALVAFIASPAQALGQVMLPRRADTPVRAHADDPGMELLLGLALAILHHREGSAPDSLLVPIRTQGSRRPLFLIHPAGAAVRCYEALARHLDEDQPVYGLQPPAGLGKQEGVALDEMAQRWREAIRSVQPEGPYFLGGWSVGGVAAFAVAGKLREQGQQVELIALLDTKPPAKEASAGAIKKEVAQRSRQVGLGISLGFFLHLSPEEQSRYVVEVARGSGAFRPDTTAEDLRHPARDFKAYLRAVREYEVQPHPGRVVLFRAGRAREKEDVRMGWDRFAGEFRMEEAPGNHATLLQEPHVKQIGEKLKGYLEQRR
jgi:thioesterase domain-containing protein